ncbi:MAG: cation:proton antiporter [Desulfonatronovibrio sp.]
MEDVQLVQLVFLGLLMTIGFAAGDYGERFGIPRVVMYIVVGAMFSGDLLGEIVPVDLGRWSMVLTEIALGIIAFIVGSELNIQWIRTRGREVVTGVLGQSVGTVIIVAAGVWLYLEFFTNYAQAFQIAVVLGAISSATAPAATVAIIEEFRTTGPLTSMLLSIVAIDDALAIIFFTLAMSFFASSAESNRILLALWEIGGAVILATVLGSILGWYSRRIHEDRLRLPLDLGFLFLIIGTAQVIGLSVLLSCMVLGFISKLFYRHKTQQWLHPINAIQESIFLIFFTLAGIHFEFNVFAGAFFFIMFYIFLRSMGKYGGAWAGTKIGGSPAKVSSNVGWGLLPQAGVATGLALQIVESGAFPDHSALILNTILGSTIVFELASPFMAKFGLARAGEIGKSTSS